MKKRLLLQANPTTEVWRWLYFTDSGHPSLPVHDGQLDELAAELAQTSADVVLLVPSADVVLRRIAFTPEERRHVLKTARFDLEDQLITDVDSLHFAYAKPGAAALDVAVVEQQKMQSWLEPLQDLPVNVVAVLSTQMALPHSPHDWVATPDGNGLSVKTAALQGFSAQFDSAQLAWDLCTREHEALPDSIRVFADPQVLEERILPSMPPTLAERVDARHTPWWNEVSWANLVKTPLNLLQGEFSPSVAWGKLWNFWRAAIILLGSAALLQTGVACAQNVKLKNENLRLRQEISAVYQEAFPNSPVTDPEKQMRSKLKRLQTGAQSTNFLPLFYQTSETLAEFGDLKLLSINFDSRADELRADLVAKKFQDLDRVRAALGKQSIDAQLVNSSSVDEGVRAKMKFRSKS